MEKRTSTVRRLLAALVAFAATSGALAASAPNPDWTAPQAPFRIYGNTYYVGSKGLTSLLITSDFGHVLIDGGLPGSAPQIIASIETLGFKPADVKAILNSHAHYDHAGGLAELQRLTGAPVYVRRPSEEVLRTGKLTRSDPQFGLKAPAIPPVPKLWIVGDEQWLGIGSNRLQAIATAGHTPGGTTWTWDSCAGDKCLRMVYADSLSPVSADKFKFTTSKDYPSAMADFAQALQRLETMPCDVLITPHPEVSDFFARIAARSADKPESLRAEGGCRQFAQGARAKLEQRVASEQ